MRLSDNSGFTLVEILVALGLTLLLVTAVYMALDLHYQMSTAGRGAATKAQLERAILQRMEADLRSVVFQLPEAATAEGQAADDGQPADSGDTGSTGSSSDAPGANSTEAMSFEIQSGSSSAETGETAPTGLIGDSNEIILFVSRPSREGYATSDLREIRYFIADRQGEGLSKAMADRVPEQRIDDPDHDPKFDHLVGLSRLDGDAMQLQFADEEQAGDEALALQSELLAPEVVELQFRYYDGMEWYDDWDSQAAGMLPAAVEITLGFVYEPLPMMGRRPGVDSERTRTIGYRRYVVRLPLATPTLPDSVL